MKKFVLLLAITIGMTPVLAEQAKVSKKIEKMTQELKVLEEIATSGNTFRKRRKALLSLQKKLGESLSKLEEVQVGVEALEETLNVTRDTLEVTMKKSQLMEQALGQTKDQLQECIENEPKELSCEINIFDKSFKGFGMSIEAAREDALGKCRESFSKNQCLVNVCL